MDRRTFLTQLGVAGLLPFLPASKAAATPAAAGTRPLGLNLAGLSYWASERPFSNLAYGASRWRVQVKGAPFTWDAELPPMTEKRYPKVIPANAVLESFLVWNRREHLPDELFVLYDGKGKLEYLGGARLEARRPGIDRVRNIHNEAAFTAQLVATDENDPLRDLRVQEGEGKPASTFRDVFLDRLTGMTALRFMDWMNTNKSKQRDWRERPMREVFGHVDELGVPVEDMVELCNLQQARPWFNMPHLADDGYIRGFAELVRDKLDPNLSVYVEYSNELWNSMFPQAAYAAEQGLKLGLSPHAYEAQLRFYARRTTQILSIWEDVFGAARDRVIGVYAAHSANEWTSTTILSFEGVKDHADVLAIAPYFGAGLGAPERAREVGAWSLDTLFDALTQEVAGENKRLIHAQAGIARQFGVELVAYEGGQHLAGFGGAEEDERLTALFIAANRDPRMGVLYAAHLENWWNAGGGVYALFSSMSEPSKWGSWGLLEYEGGSHVKWEAARSLLR